MPNFGSSPVLFEVPKLEASILAVPHENVRFTRAWAFSYFWRKCTKSKSMLLHIESCHFYGPNCFYSVDFARRICILKTPPFSTLDLLSRTSKWSFKLDFSMNVTSGVFSWPKSTTSQRILEGLACDTGPSKMFAHFRPVCNPFWWAINEKTSMLSSPRIHLKLSTCPFVWSPYQKQGWLVLVRATVMRRLLKAPFVILFQNILEVWGDQEQHLLVLSAAWCCLYCRTY